MSQTSYPSAPSRAYAGMLADTTPKTVETGVNKESAAEMPFGAALCQHTNEQECRLPAASNAKLIGLLMHAHSYAAAQLGATGVKIGQVLNVMRRGRLYVTVETAVAPGDRLHVRYAAGAGGTQLGACRNAAVGGETIDATAQGVFRSAASAGGVAVLEVDFVNT